MRLIPLLLALPMASLTIAADSGRDREHDYDPPVPGTYSLPVVKPAAGGALTDSAGKPVDLRDLTHGRITVLSFIYTRCADGRACPYASNVLGQLQLASEKDKALSDNMRLVSLSFDPADTPQRMAEYGDAMRETKTGCEWRFVVAKSPSDLEPILKAYNQAVDKRANSADPLGPLYHVLRVFLIDTQGRVRNIYSSGTLDLRLVLADVKTLMLEQAKN